MARSPERLKPRHIAVQGLRILLLHVADELARSLPPLGEQVNWEGDGGVPI